MEEMCPFALLDSGVLEKKGAADADGQHQEPEKVQEPLDGKGVEISPT